MIQDIQTAQNAIYLDEATPGKGRYFKSRFLETGLVKYSFGVCLLTKENADKFVYDFIGCPIVIDHKEVTKENEDKTSQGNICHVWFEPSDGWYWCDGIIDKQEAIDCINEGYGVSCQYEITEYADNTTNELHNGNEFDKTILNGKPEHLAIVQNPRYENALIAVNAICKNEEENQKNNIVQSSILQKFKKEFKEALTKEVRRLGELRAKNEEPKDWITIKGNHIPIKEGQSKKETVREFIENKQTEQENIKKETENKEKQKEVIETLEKQLKSRYEEIQELINKEDISEEEYEKLSRELENFDRGESEYHKKIREEERKNISTYSKTNAPEIAKTKKGEEMNFEEADSNKSNPSYNIENARELGYRTNCQTCVLAYELRRRGYNLEANPMDEKDTTMTMVAKNPDRVWIIPGTNVHPHSTEKEYKNGYELQDWLNEEIEPAKRYNFRYYWKDEEGNEGGHILTVYRESVWDSVKIYDPQTAKEENIRDFEWHKLNPNYPVGLLRVDNLEINQKIANRILKNKN